MKEIHGNLIELALNGEFDVIIHGCNCFCTMGKGIAKTIKEIFPTAYEADAGTITGAKDKLGFFSYAIIGNSGESITVVNAYTQYDYKGQGPQIDYEAVARVFMRIKNRFSGKRIGYPKIGAGLAGGDWEEISKIIDTTLENEDHTLVTYNK